MLDTILVATTNRGKLREIQSLLGHLPVTLRTLADFPAVVAPEETGVTFEENARLKALYYSRVSRLPTVAEDSGLEIDALGGDPGVHSARFGGADTTYAEKFALIYERLRASARRDRTARFVCALALAVDGRIAFETRGTVEGEIAPEPRGSGGFGYDPIFYYSPFNATLAEVGERKSEVSHRAMAFRRLADFLRGQSKQGSYR